jgi:hypothetical protein
MKCRLLLPACGFKLVVFGSLGRERGSQCPRARALGSIRAVVGGGGRAGGGGGRGRGSAGRGRVVFT